MQLKSIASCTAVSCVLLLAGCGSDGPETADVSGTVTLDGKPVVRASITFFSQGPDGSPSYGKTNDQGKYTLMFTHAKRGAMLGKHNVEIETPKLSRSEVAELKAAGQEVPAHVALPKKYREPGALTAEVKRGSNTIDFPLQSN